MRPSILLALLASAPALGQNDECSNALVVPLGVTPFDTTAATSSQPPLPCSFGGGPDLWFRFVAPTAADVRFETCGSSFDTALEVLRGSDCGALQPVDCNDDSCGLASAVTVAASAGEVYTIRVGGFAGGAGQGVLRILELVPPANDTCATAAALAVGATPFDTTHAMADPAPWGCGAGGGPDVWFRHDPATDEDLRFSTCGAGFDTLLEVYSGACGALVPRACNDDACGTASTVLVTGVVPSETLWVRIGGFGGAAGVGHLALEVIPHPVEPPLIGSNCVRAAPISSVGGSGTTISTFYFNLTTSEMASFDGIFLHVNEQGPIGLEVYTRPGTYRGGMASSADWTLVAMDDGAAVGAGPFELSYVQFAQPLSLAAGTRGVALVGLGMGHRYSANATFPQSSLDGVVTITAGATTEFPFTGAPFTPRYWEGALCHGAPQPGTNFCSPPVNSTGAAAWISGAGSAALSSNDLVLTANALPPGVPALFLVAPMQGIVFPHPPGSGGTLCLDGPIGRYSAPGQPQVANAAGQASLPIDLQALPGPGGAVAAQPGETWSFQAWYRDQNAAGSSITYFSGGLAVTVE